MSFFPVFLPILILQGSNAVTVLNFIRIILETPFPQFVIYFGVLSMKTI